MLARQLNSISDDKKTARKPWNYVFNRNFSLFFFHLLTKENEEHEEEDLWKCTRVVDIAAKRNSFKRSVHIAQFGFACINIYCSVNFQGNLVNVAAGLLPFSGDKFLFIFNLRKPKYTSEYQWTLRQINEKVNLRSPFENRDCFSTIQPAIYFLSTGKLTYLCVFPLIIYDYKKQISFVCGLSVWFSFFSRFYFILF